MVILILAFLAALLVLGLSFAVMTPVYRRVGEAVNPRKDPPSR